MLLKEETYEKFGYEVSELSKYSRKIILVQCEYCFNPIEKTYSNYILEKEKNKIIQKDCCEYCIGRKLKEISKVKMASEKIPDIRTCSKCKNDLPLNEKHFNRDKTSKFGFKYACKECFKKEHREKVSAKPEKTYDYEEALIVYNYTINNNIKELPKCFWDKINKEDTIALIKNIINENMNIEEIPLKFNTKFIESNRLLGLKNKFKTNYKFIDFVFPYQFKPWEFERIERGYWENEDHRKDALKWFVNMLKRDKIINSDNEIPKKLTYALFEKYGLAGLVANYYNFSPYLAMKQIYEERFKEWEYNVIVKGFYFKEENKKKIMEWFVEKLISDKLINSLEEIPNIVSIELFKSYGLGSFLYSNFGGVTYNAFNFIYQDKWKPWEFRSCPTGYWEDKSNIIDAVNWFVEKMKLNLIIEKIDDLRNIPITKLMYEYNLKTVLKNYNHKVGKLLSECFPEIFNENDFGRNILSSDGIRFDSLEEKIIHNVLKSTFKDVQYYENNQLKDNKWHNAETNENYVADWLINDNIIVEYFGMYNLKNKRDYFIKYNEKTHRKIDYFRKLKDYRFIALFPDDLKNNLHGVKEKIRKYHERKEIG